MCDEFDVVKATAELSRNVPAGSTGTILMIYNDGEAYEVEFTQGITTLDVLTVRPEDIVIESP